MGTSRQYNVRDDIKDSFDQAGLDDIKLEDSLQKNVQQSRRAILRASLRDYIRDIPASRNFAQCDL